MTSRGNMGIMARNNTIVAAFGAAALAVTALATPADAFGDRHRDHGGSMKDVEEAPSRRCDWTINIAGTSDYVFRGFSQTLEDPALQGGSDLSCGIFYAGVWASGVDFVEGSGGPGSGDATVEVDVYGGIKPKLGMVEFDLGVIGYLYPGGKDRGAELDYLELKAGASTEVNNISVGGTFYWSPEYTLATGDAFILEGSLGYEFQSIRHVTPSIDGVVGTVLFDDETLGGTDYVYWNVGLGLALDKLSLDFRYWDTDIDSSLSDERFVFTASVELP